MTAEPNEFSNRFDHSVIQQLIQAGVINMAAPVPERPQERPPRPLHWVDRVDDLDRIGTHLTSGDRAAVVVTGPAGIGKSSLAAMLAEHLESRFPDGQLYIDLGGDDPKSAMRSVLSRLGVPKDFIQDSFAGMVSQYRTATKDKVILVVVDEAPDRETGLQFAPASAGAGFLLIGYTWPADIDVVHHEMDALPSQHSIDLLIKICPELSRAEAARYIARFAWSPGKVRALAGFVRTRERAEEAQPTELRAIADYSAAELLTATGQMLSPSAAWLYGLLLRIPGDGVDAGAISVLGTEGVFAELVDAQLATQTQPGRWRIEGRPVADGLPIEYRHVMPALVAWFRTRAQHADAEVMGGRMRLVDLDPSFASQLTASAADPFAKHEGLPWLNANRRTLTGLVRIAALAGWSREACAIAEALWALFTNVPLPEEAVACYRTAVDAADGPIAKARMLICLGRRLVDLHSYDESEAALRAAVALAETVGGESGPTLACSAFEQLGWLYYVQERWAEAETVYRQALAIAEELNRARSQALLHKLIGFVYRDQGRGAEARTEFALALPEFEGRKDERNTAVVGFELAALAIAEGEQTEVEKADNAIGVMRRRGLERDAANALERLGGLLDGDDRRLRLEIALEIFDRFSELDAERVRGLLG
ncbi:tetratricopeptide repeat protein [Glycomyces dulcitolivorans]|uniref:tetratricopeptide repeat protein n=1 Tax=Glycomyces dulcitolivorans TaxID=2200759 RepID=UPI000DD2BA04|nr:tetratricopeptide repeat protein [Glycomyces dulcitolivorans]